MEQNFKLLSLNVNGLNEVRKRRVAFKFLKKFRNSIILLQETHCRRGCARLWKSQWPGSMFLSEGSGNQGGVAILFSGDLKPKITRVFTHAEDRFIIAQFDLDDIAYTVVSVYMPTSDQESQQINILNELDKKLEDSQETEIFIGGDFNVAMHSNLDRQGYVHSQIHNPSFRAQLIHFLEKQDLIDIWRIQNQQKKNFSWSRAHKMARLDYIFLPSSFLGITAAESPHTCSFSDHRLISVSIHPHKIERGRGFWRMQTFILEREDFRIQLREYLTDRIDNSHHLPHDIRWEFVKLGIREFSIQYCNQLRDQTQRLERELQKRLTELEEEIIDSLDSREEYYAIKRELLQIQLLASRQAMLRSRMRWLGQGERPTRYFLNLEKKNFNDKTISSVYDNEGILLTDRKEILEYEKEHFQKQHSPMPNSQNPQNDPFTTDLPSSPLEDLDRAILNDEITLDELEKAARMMHNGKSPGCDGIPIEFYKRFWDLVGPLLLASFLLSAEKGLLSPNQRRAVVTLIPKKNKDKRYIHNWRPISVLNVDYKIFAKALALRLANIIPLLTHLNQTGFVPSRYIGDNIRNISAIMEFLNETGRGGLIVSLDFKAAFDSLDHSFLFRVLESFNLGDNFLSWIRTLYRSTESCILNRGFSTGWFSFQRGIRQGCPISPFLFVLAVERLADALRSDESIEGIDLLSSHTKLLQFADDSNLFMKNERSLLNALSTIDRFRQYSGLSLNLSKTFGMNIGDIKLESDLVKEIEWRESLHILGITFSKDSSEKQNFDNNFSPALAKMENVCRDWTKHTLSLKGKIVLINTLILPIIYFQCTMLAVSARVFTEVNRIISSFLWSGKRPKISKQCLELPTVQGGLGLHNFRNRIASAKMTWVKKASKPPTEPWQHYLEFRADKDPYEIFLQRTDHTRVKSSPFFKEILFYWRELYREQPCTDLSVRNESLWGNGFLKGKFKKKIKSWCEDRNIHKVQDLLYADQIISPEQFERRFHTAPIQGLLQTFQLILPDEWKLHLAPINKFAENRALYIFLEKGKRVNLRSVSTKSIYEILQARRKAPYTCDKRWERVYNDNTFHAPLKWKHWHLLPYKTSHSVQLQNFMFRIAYRIIPTKVYLHRIHVVDSDLCQFCLRRDDLLHFFFECVEVRPFWDSIVAWIDQNEEVMDFPENLSEEEFLLGSSLNLPSHYLLNYITMWAKFYVYKTRIFGHGKPDFFQFLLELKNRLNVEKLACLFDGSYNRRFRRWENFYNSF